MAYNFKDRLIKIFEDNSLTAHINEVTLDAFARLADAMMSAKLNISAIKDPDSMILRHFADSLTLSPYIPTGARVADIGCGGGFPSFPLAIARPDLSIVGFDSTAKKIAYINETAQALSLTNLRGISLRVEEGAHDEVFRESFDLVTARAVAALPTLSEYCLPYVKVGGVFAAMKSRTAELELEQSKRAISMLGGSLSRTVELELVADFEQEPLYRSIILVDKVKKTDKKYPRNNSQISKKPL